MWDLLSYIDIDVDVEKQDLDQRYLGWSAINPGFRLCRICLI